MNQETEKVAAGLRSIKSTPDAFLYSVRGDSAFDDNEILGIPVFNFQGDFFYEYTDHDVLFFPIWRDTKDHSIDIKRFRDGYSDCCLFQNIQSMAK